MSGMPFQMTGVPGVGMMPTPSPASQPEEYLGCKRPRLAAPTGPSMQHMMLQQRLASVEGEERALAAEQRIRAAAEKNQLQIQLQMSMFNSNSNMY